MISSGNTFLYEDEDGYDCHLCIVVTPPSDGEVVIVSITTRRARSETLSCLKKGEHPFIRHDSVISYAYSRVTAVKDIEKAVKNGTAKAREDVSANLLRRAREGLIESDRTPRWVKQRYKEIMDQ